MTETISLILNFVLSSGLLGTLVFYKLKKREATAAATHSENSSESVAIANMRESAVEWKAIAEAREEKLVHKDELIDKLYSEKSEDRGTIHGLMQENQLLRLENQRLEFRLCNRRACLEREPQSGF